MPQRTTTARVRQLLAEEMAIPLGFAVVFFFLQARYLHIAAMPGTDEGVYAQVGRLMMQGFVPHGDFAFFHMPLLPLFAGVFGEVLRGVYGARLLFLFLNSFAVIPMYFVFMRITRDRVAAATAVFFYLTYHEMVHHDFRFLAIRQLANDLLIAYAFFGTVARKWRYSFAAQTACAIASGLLFLPSLLAIGVLSPALAFSGQDGVPWRGEIRRYAIIGLAAVGATVCYLLLPNAFQQIVLDQFGRSDESKMLRIGNLPDLDKDVLFYAMSTAFLVLGAAFHRPARPLALSMLGIVAIALLLSSNFYPHYLSAAGPAFAFGIFCGVVLAGRAFASLGQWRPLGVAVVVGLAVATHASIVLPSLLGEWIGNRPHEYGEITRELRRAGGPVLAMEPIYAVSARVDMVNDLLPAYTRPPVGRRSFSDEEFEAMASKACSILLDGSLRGVVPGHIVERWTSRYERVVDNSWATVLLTHNASCRS